ncbi:MAG: hypothetical protein QM504_04555 [Pseudomonadota bacterium]
MIIDKFWTSTSISSSPFKRMDEIKKMTTKVAASAIFGIAIGMIQLCPIKFIEHPLASNLDEVFSVIWSGTLIQE